MCREVAWFLLQNRIKQFERLTEVRLSRFIALPPLLRLFRLVAGIVQEGNREIDLHRD